MALHNRLRQSPAGSTAGDIAKGSEGTSVIEMAVTFPILFTLIFCFMELCLLFYSRAVISQCAREGTRYAMFHGASCPTSANPTCEATATQVNTYVANRGWPNLAGGTMTVATTYPNGNESVGSLVKVTITYVFPVKMPFVPRRSFTITTASEAYIIQ